jgi:hypothetical protein
VLVDFSFTDVVKRLDAIEGMLPALAIDVS